MSNELDQISQLLSEAQGYGPSRILIDPSVVRGLGYYTGPGLVAELTFEILDEKGRKRLVWLGCGRRCAINDLVKRFTGQAKFRRRAFRSGWIGCLRHCAPRGAPAVDTAGPVVVTVMDRDRMADYMAMVGELRQAGDPGGGLSG